MKIASGILVPISGISATAFFHFHHDTFGVIFVFAAFLFATMFVWLSIKDHNSEKNKPLPQQPMMVITDDDTRLIIRAISDETNGFLTVNDIVRNTNLPLKTINKALDWLLMNNFAIQRKGRNGKVYILTPGGRSTFSQLINENINKPQT
ncbi:MAG: winged helix-turn-helix domain-containing protein [bacterium]